MTFILDVFGLGLLLGGIINAWLYLTGADPDPELRVIVMVAEVSAGAVMVTLADVARRIRRRTDA